jgi:hypothetical protein
LNDVEYLSPIPPIRWDLDFVAQERFRRVDAIVDRFEVSQAERANPAGDCSAAAFDLEMVDKCHVDVKADVESSHKGLGSG